MTVTNTTHTLSLSHTVKYTNIRVARCFFLAFTIESEQNSVRVCGFQMQQQQQIFDIINFQHLLTQMLTTLIWERAIVARWLFGWLFGQQIEKKKTNAHTHNQMRKSCCKHKHTIYIYATNIQNCSSKRKSRSIHQVMLLLWLLRFSRRREPEAKKNWKTTMLDATFGD